MAILELKLDILAKPTPRGRQSKRSVKQHIYNSAEYKAYKEMIGAMILCQLPGEPSPIVIQHLITVISGATRGDADNFQKAVMDTLKDIGMIKDDSKKNLYGQTSLFIEGKPQMQLSIIYDEIRPYHMVSKKFDLFDRTFKN